LKNITAGDGGVDKSFSLFVHTELPVCLFPILKDEYVDL